MQPTTRRRCTAAGEPRTIGRIARPSTLWPAGSSARRAARSRTSLDTVPGRREVRRLHGMRTRVFAGLSLAAVLAMSGCGGSGGSSSTTSGARGVTTLASKAYALLLTDINQLNDHGFNALAYKGLLKAKRDLGIKGDVYQSSSGAQYIPNLATAARKKADLVISVGFDQAAAIAKVAKQFPNTKFAIIDV